MPNFLKTEKVKKMRRQRNIFQTKNKKTPRKKVPNETKFSKLLSKGFKVTKILTEFRRIKEHSEN